MLERDGDSISPCLTLKRRLPIETFYALRNEASTSRGSSKRITAEKCILEDGGAVNGRGSCGVSGPGPCLRSFHSGFGLELATQLAKRGDLFPTRSSYLYYEPEDYSFLHHDAVHAHITLIVGLSDGLLPLFLYPNFGTASTSDIDTLNGIVDLRADTFERQMSARFESRGRSYQMPVEEGDVIAIPGRRVPHARPQQEVEGIVATACYAFLIAPREWLVAYD